MNFITGQKQTKVRNAAMVFLAMAISSLVSSHEASACTKTSNGSYIKGQSWYSDYSMKIGEECTITFSADLNAGVTGLNIINTAASSGISVNIKPRSDNGTSFVVKSQTEGTYDVAVLIQAIVSNATSGGGRGPQSNWQGFMFKVSK